MVRQKNQIILIYSLTGLKMQIIIIGGEMCQLRTDKINEKGDKIRVYSKIYRKIHENNGR